MREAAGARFDGLELHALLYVVSVTDDRRQVAEQVAQFLASAPPTFMINTGKTVEEVLASPRFLIGTVEQIVEELVTRRERYGISYLTVTDLPGLPSNIDAFSPIAAQLAGK